MSTRVCLHSDSVLLCLLASAPLLAQVVPPHRMDPAARAAQVWVIYRVWARGWRAHPVWGARLRAFLEAEERRALQRHDTVLHFSLSWPERRAAINVTAAPRQAAPLEEESEESFEEGSSSEEVLLLGSGEVVVRRRYPAPWTP